jgi:hypothetical protein
VYNAPIRKSAMFEDFDYDYNHILEDVEDLDLYDDDDEYGLEDDEEWDSYYHNIADELIDD